LLAVAATLLLISLALTALIQSEWFRATGPSRPVAPVVAANAPDWRARVDSARQALASGAYQLASQELRAARDQAGDQTPADRRKVAQMLRQAELLADLPEVSLPEALRRIGPPRPGWADEFARRLRGRAIVFDAEVRRDASGSVQIDYPLFAGDKPVRLNLDPLKVLQRLPLAAPQRLFFGARVAEAKPDALGQWVVSPDPDSGVLFTEPDILTGTSVPADAALIEVMRRQAEWVEGE
jgi:hypothetical protein